MLYIDRICERVSRVQKSQDMGGNRDEFGLDFHGSHFQAKLAFKNHTAQNIFRNSPNFINLISIGKTLTNALKSSIQHISNKINILN